MQRREFLLRRDDREKGLAVGFQTHWADVTILGSDMDEHADAGPVPEVHGLDTTCSHLHFMKYPESQQAQNGEEIRNELVEDHGGLPRLSPLN